MTKKVTALPSERREVQPEYRVYTRYSPPPRHAPHPPGESRTVQTAIAECDVNNIMRRLMSGMDPGVPIKTGFYRDETQIRDMKSNLDIIRSHESAFNQLPEGVKAQYGSVSRYYDAMIQDLESEQGNSESLDVTVPTDSKAVSSQKKGEKNEAKTSASSSSEANLPSSNKSSS